MRIGWAATVVAMLALGGCRDQEVGGDQPITPGALAWVAAEHFGPPTSASRFPAASRRIGAGAVATKLAYDEALSVAVMPAPETAVCDAPLLGAADDCVKTADGYLAWILAQPEEDPGVVYVVVPKDDSWAIVLSSGPEAVTKDPRELQFSISVDDMFDLANDPRVDLTTTQAAIDGGDALDYWGQPDL